MASDPPEDEPLSEVESLRTKVRAYEYLIAHMLDEEYPAEPRARIEAVRATLENSCLWRERDPVGYFAAGHRDLIAKYVMERAPVLGDLAL